VLSIAACGRVGFDPFSTAGDNDGPAIQDGAVDGKLVTKRIIVEVAGGGTVVSTPPGIACPGSCDVEFPLGTPVTLTATSLGVDQFLGWDGAECSIDPTCLVAFDDVAPIGATFTGAYNLVFATTSNVPVVGRTLQSADDACLAAAAGANLPGTYVAWMSTSTVDAIDRLGSASGWVTLDGLPFAATRQSLIAGDIAHPIRFDASRQIAGITYTGTQPDGRFSGTACDNWTTTTGTSPIGMLDGSSTNFTDGLGPFPCNLTAGFLQVLCFGTDFSAPIPLRKHRGRLAFLSPSTWMSGAGIGDADVLCQTTATTAGVGGSFKAFLGLDAGGFESRFDLERPTWVRPDGKRIVARAANIASGAVLLTTIHVRVDGTPDIGARVLTGGPTANCSDWLDASAAGLLGAGQLLRSGAYIGSTGLSCDAIGAVYCLQE
jgi:hypothetical protein